MAGSRVCLCTCVCVRVCAMKVTTALSQTGHAAERIILNSSSTVHLQPGRFPEAALTFPLAYPFSFFSSFASSLITSTFSLLKIGHWKRNVPATPYSDQITFPTTSSSPPGATVRAVLSCLPLISFFILVDPLASG